MNKIKTYRILQVVIFLLSWIILSLIFYFYGGAAGVAAAAVLAGAVSAGVAVLIGALCEIFILAFLESKINKIENE